MGYSLSWVAVKLPHGDQEIKKLLKLKSERNTKQYGTYGLVGCQLDNGWYLLIANKFNAKILDKKNLALLSKTNPTVACSVEEHVMFSSSEFWQNGKKVWSLTHHGDEDRSNIKEIGSLPSEYINIKREYTEKQKKEDETNAEVDYIFDLPLLLAKKLAGFKHDEINDTNSTISYEIFEDGVHLKFLRRLPVPNWLRWIGQLLYFFAIFVIILAVLAFILVFCFQILISLLSSLK